MEKYPLGTEAGGSAQAMNNEDIMDEIEPSASTIL